MIIGGEEPKSSTIELVDMEMEQLIDCELPAFPDSDTLVRADVFYFNDKVGVCFNQESGYNKCHHFDGQIWNTEVATGSIQSD